MQRVGRITIWTILIGGREIPKGAPVTAYLGSANRDLVGRRAGPHRTVRDPAPKVMS